MAWFLLILVLWKGLASKRDMFVVGNLSEMPMGQEIHRRETTPPGSQDITLSRDDMLLVTNIFLIKVSLKILQWRYLIMMKDISWLFFLLLRIWNDNYFCLCISIIKIFLQSSHSFEEKDWGCSPLGLEWIIVCWKFCDKKANEWNLLLSLCSHCTSLHHPISTLIFY